MGLPSFGEVRGPPGPLLEPMLLLEEPPSFTSTSWTEIGGSNAGFVTDKLAAWKTKASKIACRSREGNKKALRNNERTESSQAVAELFMISVARDLNLFHVGERQ
jgi:hypothetical protein